MQSNSTGLRQLPKSLERAYRQAPYHANATGLSRTLGAISRPMLTARGWISIGGLTLAALVAGCRKPAPNQDRAPTADASLVPGSPTAMPSANVAGSTAWGLSDLQRLFALSEAGERFISDNVVSNETSLLQPSQVLAGLRGGAYIGVGPEQNFTYIALTRPELAIIVDLRRDNALLQLLYKALFEVAQSRLEFLCLLLGRPYDPKLEPAQDAGIDVTLAVVQTIAPVRDWFARQQAGLDARIRRYGLDLSEDDMVRIKRMHELFFVRQLDLRFELHKANGRKYPSLQNLLRLRSPSGYGTFLDTRDSFEFVQGLERQHRIVPLVGDVSQLRSLGAIADELGRRGLRLRAFYISNVEQYLIGRPSFRGWLDNLRRLPHDERSVLVRCYLDQGRPHPRQEPGQRSTSLAQGVMSFLDSATARLPTSYFEIVTDESLLVDRSGYRTEDTTIP
jgi:hypothetical protein